MSDDTEPVSTTEERIFVTGFWGFEPADEGYVGFTHESTRDRLLADWLEGDLMLIIGVQGQHSQPHDVGRCLGVVELEPRAILDYEGESPAAYNRKVRLFGAERWRFGMPIRRAWFVGREIKARHVAPNTCAANNARAVASSYMLLTDEEAARVRSLPLRRAALWGQPEWTAAATEDVAETSLEREFRRGPAPTFGTYSATTVDGLTYLYLMVLQGPLDAMFPKLCPTSTGKAVVKVGITNDTKARCDELNCGFPPDSGVRWTVAAVQRFPNGAEAYAAESRALEDMRTKGRSLGKEFGIVPVKELPSFLATYAGSSAFRIVV